MGEQTAATPTTGVMLPSRGGWAELIAHQTIEPIESELQANCIRHNRRSWLAIETPAQKRFKNNWQCQPVTARAVVNHCAGDRSIDSAMISAINRLGRQPLKLLDFAVNRVLVAVGAKLFQFEARSGVAAVLLGGVARHAGRTLVSVGTALGALQGDYEPYVFTFSHGGTLLMVRSVQRVCDWTIVRRRISAGQNRRGAIADRAELLVSPAKGVGQFCSTLSSHKTFRSIAQQPIPALHLQIQRKAARRLDND